MGDSMGAFTTNNAFGLEGDIPAVWGDGPPMTPESVFENGCRRVMEGMGLGFLADLIVDHAWETVLEAAQEKGVDLERHLPADVLPHGPDTNRRIHWVGNSDDLVV